MSDQSGIKFRRQVMNRDNLIEEYQAALYEQLAVKRDVFAAQRAYSVAKAEAYIAALANKKTHWQAQSLATLDTDVIRLREQVDEAKLRHYEAWIHSHILREMIGDHDLDSCLNNNVNDDNDCGE